MDIENKSNITIVNQIQFSFEVKGFVITFLKEKYSFNDDIVEYLLENLVTSFLKIEKAACNRYGFKLLFDEVTKEKLINFVIITLRDNRIKSPKKYSAKRARLSASSKKK